MLLLILHVLSILTPFVYTISCKCPLCVCLNLKLWIIFKIKMPQKKYFTPFSSHNGRSGSNSNLGISPKIIKKRKPKGQDNQRRGMIP
jgi:hypothetical protein